jgi:hypothetical protein
MTDLYPLRPDLDWHASLIARYGDVVPAIDRLRIRHGLRVTVEDLIDQIVLADRYKVCRLAGVTTRNAGFVAIEVEFTEAAQEADRRLIGMVVRQYQEILSTRCEHCGSESNLSILKIGMEAMLADPDIEPGDRLLCSECLKETLV